MSESVCVSSRLKKNESKALSVRLNDYAKKVDRNAILQLVNEFKGASLK